MKSVKLFWLKSVDFGGENNKYFACTHKFVPCPEPLWCNETEVVLSFNLLAEVLKIRPWFTINHTSQWASLSPALRLLNTHSLCVRAMPSQGEVTITHPTNPSSGSGHPCGSDGRKAVLGWTHFTSSIQLVSFSIPTHRVLIFY